MNRDLVRETVQEGNLAGEGGEHKVYITKDREYVVKIPNLDTTRNGQDRPPELIKFLSSPERKYYLEQGYRECERIIGGRLIPTWFLYTEHPVSGEPSYAVVQKNMEKMHLVEWNRMPSEKQAAILNDPSQREEVLELIWSIKKYFHTFKVPFDFYSANIAYREHIPSDDTDQKRFYFVEVGFPTIAREVLLGTRQIPYINAPFRREFIHRILDQYINGKNKGIIGLKGIDEKIRVTEEERKRFNEKYFQDPDFDFPAFLQQMETEYQELDAQLQ